MQLLIKQEVDAQPFVGQLRLQGLVLQTFQHEMHRGKRRLHFMDPGQEIIFLLLQSGAVIHGFFLEPFRLFKEKGSGHSLEGSVPFH
ncbi:hypothetical protein D3C77_543940 [compost metagenome]